MKTCSNCKYELSLDAFYNSKATKDGKQNICKDCSKAKSRSYYLANQQTFINRAKLRARGNHLMDRYGITEEQYEVLLVQQNGVCAICGNKCQKQENLCVDHDHETGKVRGLLCDNCNVGLGRFKDSLKLLLKAAEYLEMSDANKEGDFRRD